MSREVLTEVNLPQRVMNLKDLLEKASKPGGMAWAHGPLNYRRMPGS
jgi:hypothetical protein